MEIEDNKRDFRWKLVDLFRFRGRQAVGILRLNFASLEIRRQATGKLN